MELKNTFINLVGFFKCSIENNIVLCDGLFQEIKNDEDDVMVQAFRFDVFDTTTNTIPYSILVIFNQVKDKLLFLYKKDKFEVISITDNLIKVSKDGIEYFIERTQPPF